MYVICSCILHLRNLLTHTLLFWHFLENLNFELKNILEYIRTMFSGNTWLFLKIIDLELKIMEVLVENFKKLKSQIYNFSNKSIRKT